MTCSSCGASFPEDRIYCPYCGAAIVPINQQNGSYQMPQYSVNDYKGDSYGKTASIGQYVGWTLLAYALGPVSFILTIIFACMGDNKNRANYFRAQLVIWAIGVVVSIIVAVLCATVFSSAVYGLSQYAEDYDFMSMFISLL